MCQANLFHSTGGPHGQCLLITLLIFKSDKNEVSPYMITACSNIQVMGKREQSPRIRCLDIE